MTEELKMMFKYENEILELIDNQDDYTRSDLQSRAMAIVMAIVHEVKSSK